MVGLETRAHEESFKSSFRLRRRVLFALGTAVFAAFFLAALEALGTSDLAARFGLSAWALPGTALATAGGAVVVSLLAWRCPACRRFLGAEVRPSYCRRCGCPFD